MIINTEFSEEENERIKKELEEFTKRPFQPITIESGFKCTYRLPCGWCEKMDKECVHN